MNGNYDSENNFNYNGNNINDKSDNNLKNTEEPGQYSSDSFYVNNSGAGASHQNVRNNNNNENIKKEKNYSDAALILGLYTLLSLFICCGFLNLVTGIISIIFAIKAKNKNPIKTMNSKAIAGLICSIIGIVLTFLTYIALVVMIMWNEALITGESSTLFGSEFFVINYLQK